MGTLPLLFSWWTLPWEVKGVVDRHPNFDWLNGGGAARRSVKREGPEFSIVDRGRRVL